MGRTPVVAGNWKMHTDSRAALELCLRVRQQLDDVQGVVKVVCPPFVHLALAADHLRGSTILVGAQNCHWADQGAFTGEISPLMVAGHAQFVILGHSERRTHFCETEATVNLRLRAALSHGLRPILCVGEIREEREAGRTEEVLSRQLRGALADVSVPAAFVIAYEPVWAIGTGLPATGEMANQAAGHIRAQIAALCGPALADSLVIQYGGSVTAENCDEFLRQPEIDGALVGGASLQAEAFAAIVRRAARTHSQP